MTFYMDSKTRQSMKKNNSSPRTSSPNADIIFCVTVSDVQEVAQQILGRSLSDRELKTIRKELTSGDYIDWVVQVENIIREIVNDFKIEDVKAFDKNSLYDDDDDYDMEDNLKYL